MKKFLTLACALGAVMLASSCQDEDFGADSSAIAFTSQFEKTFGKFPEDQNWDFYAQTMSSLSSTRATYKDSNPVSTDSSFYTYDDFKDIIEDAVGTSAQSYQDANCKVPDEKYNGDKGFKSSELTSTGEFDIYTALYGGSVEKSITGWWHGFRFGIAIKSNNNTKYYPIFFANASSNPQIHKTIKVPKGTTFNFYISFYEDNKSKTYFSNSNNCRILYSNVNDDSKTLILGFEDNDDLTKHQTTTGYEPDFNDFVLVIKGNLPLVKAKRFMCEDLIGDYSSNKLIDYNDLVFDVQPYDESSADVVIRAVGGTYPITLQVAGEDINKGNDLHLLFKGASSTTPINVDATDGISADPVHINVTAKNKFADLDNFKDFVVKVNKGDGFETIAFTNNGNTKKAPEVISAIPGTKWMKEDKCFNLGYPKFFTTNWWTNYVTDYLVNQ